MAKITFSVDDGTVRTLKATANRLGKPQSMVVREAIADYAARAGQLTEAEKRRALKVIDDIMAQPPSRPQAEVTREIREVRRARQAGGRRHPVK
jgi:predicted transcriptional regulator